MLTEAISAGFFTLHIGEFRVYLGEMYHTLYFVLSRSYQFMCYLKFVCCIFQNSPPGIVKSEPRKRICKRPRTLVI